MCHNNQQSTTSSTLHQEQIATEVHHFITSNQTINQSKAPTHEGTHGMSGVLFQVEELAGRLPFRDKKLQAKTEQTKHDKG